MGLQEVEAIEAKAQAFMQENQELLDDPETSADVLGRIVVQGSEIAVAWNEGVIQPAADRFVQACNDYEEALRDKTLSPKELQKRVHVYDAHTADRDKVVAGFGEFGAFITEAEEKYRAKLDEDQLAALEEFGVSEEFLENTPEVPASERPIPRDSMRTEKVPFWRRFFG